MIRGFVKGYQVTGGKRYLEVAEKAASYILKNLVDPERSGRLLATIKDGRAKLPAYLDDHAFFTAALLDLFFATGKTLWLNKAVLFQEATLKHFVDPKSIGFFFTADDHETLIDRPKSFYDSSIPSGNSVVLENLVRIFPLMENAKEKSLLEKNISGLFTGACKRAMGMTHFLCAADEFLGPSREVVLVSGTDPKEFEVFRDRLWSKYLPRTLVLLKAGKESGDHPTGLQGIFRDKKALSGKATVYICEGNTCSEPLTDFEEVRKKLNVH